MPEKNFLKRTPLYPHHIQLDARMVDFGGWEMPVQYGGIIPEYNSCRQEAALFDICHMGEFVFKGDLKEDGLDSVLTCRLDDLPLRASRYGLLLNEEGGIIDDLIIFRAKGVPKLRSTTSGSLFRSLIRFGVNLQ